MKHKDKREKQKHIKKAKWWNNFTILGDKNFAKKVARGKLKRSKGTLCEALNKTIKNEGWNIPKIGCF